MLKPIKYVEISIKKTNIKESGLLLKYDEVDDLLRLSLDGNSSTGTYSLTFNTVESILICEKDGSLTDRLFNASSASQKLARELILEIMDNLKKANRLNASGFVNLASYEGVPEKYKKPGTLNLPIVHTNTRSDTGFGRTTTTTAASPGVVTHTAPKIVFLATRINYAAGHNPAKNIAILFRKSDLPSGRLLAAMKKKALAAFEGTYKLKAEPLHEDDKDVEKDDTQLISGVYGDHDDDDYGYMGHGGMM